MKAIVLLFMLACMARSAVVVSDFGTINPLRTSDASFIGTVSTPSPGWQSIEGTGTIHSDVFSTPIDFTMGRGNILWSGAFLIMEWAQGIENPSANWTLTLTDSHGFSGGLTLSTAQSRWWVYYMPDGLDWTQISQFSISGTGHADFDTLGIGVPEPSAYAVMAGIGLMAFGTARRLIVRVH